MNRLLRVAQGIKANEGGGASDEIVQWYAERGIDITKSHLPSTLDVEALRGEGFLVDRSGFHPSDLPQYSVKIDFSRTFGSNQRSYLTIAIPYNDGGIKRDQAKEIAAGIIEREKDRYTDVVAFLQRKHTGRSYFDDRTNRQYDEPYPTV